MLFDVSSFPAVPFSFLLFSLTVKLGFHGIKREEEGEREREREREEKKKILHRLNAAPCPHAGVPEKMLW